jgi:hypothetical protein
MKEYVLVNNQQEMEKLLLLYDQLQWRANINDLKYKVKSKAIYPVVVGHQDDYAWYVNDHGNDGKKYFTVDKVLRMHNTMSHEKVIYVPYHSRPLFQHNRAQLTVHNLKELHSEGKLNTSDVGIRYVEKSLSDHGRNGFTNNHNWQHFDCALKDFKVVNFPTITSYEQVGKPKFLAGKRMSNTFTHDFWEVAINLPGAYDAHRKFPVIEKYLEITDYNSTDPMNGCCLEIRLNADSVQEPSNYLYYTLFI